MSDSSRERPVDGSDPDLTEDRDVPAGAIAVGVDGSPASQAALRWAVTEAVRRELPLHLLCSREAYLGASSLEASVVWADPGLASLDHSLTVLEEALGTVRDSAPQLAFTCSRPWGRPARHLIAASRTAGLLVLGSRGRSGLSAAVLGTVSLQTAVHAACPVVVVREGQPDHPAGSMRITVGVDGSADSVEAVRFAMSTAGAGGHVDLVLAWWLEVHAGVVVTTPESAHWEAVMAGHRETLARVLDDLPAEFPGVGVGLHVSRGRTEDVLLEAATDSDLLVVGSRGIGGFAGLLLGSVTAHVLAASRCPVAVMVDPRSSRGP